MTRLDMENPAIILLEFDDVFMYLRLVSRISEASTFSPNDIDSGKLTFFLGLQSFQVPTVP